MSLLSITIWCALSSLLNRSYFTPINSLGAVDWRGLFNLNPGITRSSGCPQAETGHLFISLSIQVQPPSELLPFIWIRIGHASLDWVSSFLYRCKEAQCVFVFSRLLGAGYLKTAQFFSLFYQVPPPSELLLSKSGLSTPAWTWSRFFYFIQGQPFSFPFLSG